MTTGEGSDPREDQPRAPEEQPRPPAEAPHRGDRIGIGGGDDSVSRIQLAARWAEAYTTDGESLATILRRFRAAYEYLDAVIHGVDPPDLDSTAELAKPAVPPPGAEMAPKGWQQGQTSPAPTPTPPAPPPWANS
jgi:hypothetical protein